MVRTFADYECPFVCAYWGIPGIAGWKLDKMRAEVLRDRYFTALPCESYSTVFLLPFASVYLYS
jgi:hypothetical protein